MRARKARLIRAGIVAAKADLAIQDLPWNVICHWTGNMREYLAGEHHRVSKAAYRQYMHLRPVHNDPATRRLYEWVT